MRISFSCFKVSEPRRNRIPLQGVRVAAPREVQAGSDEGERRLLVHGGQLHRGDNEHACRHSVLRGRQAH